MQRRSRNDDKGTHQRCESKPMSRSKAAVNGSATAAAAFVQKRIIGKANDKLIENCWLFGLAWGSKDGVPI